ncbi:MAG: Flp family type IVb pilin [Sphingomonadales bacterium]|nr:Flp family type IVb pilin [Sphingomonadales bacterium]
MKNKRLLRFGLRLLHANEAATAIEYGLIAALIAVAAITAMNGLANQIDATFNTTSSSMSSANAAAAA